jgi:hypothetical protein
MLTSSPSAVPSTGPCGAIRSEEWQRSETRQFGWWSWRLAENSKGITFDQAPFVFPESNALTASRQNAGRSSGLRLVTRVLGPLVQTTTVSSTHSPPAFFMSVFKLGHDVSLRPFKTSASTRDHGPWQMTAAGFPLSKKSRTNWTAASSVRIIEVIEALGLAGIGSGQNRGSSRIFHGSPGLSQLRLLDPLVGDDEDDALLGELLCHSKILSGCRERLHRTVTPLEGRIPQKIGFVLLVQEEPPPRRPASETFDGWVEGQ